MLAKIYQEDPTLQNLLLRPEICTALRDRLQDLKEVVLKALEADAIVPTLAASLEYIKEGGSKSMPMGEHCSDFDREPIGASTANTEMVRCSSSSGTDGLG